MSRCKECNRERVKKYHASPEGRARYRRYSLMRDYGLTVEAYTQMVVEQDGLCAICRRSPEETQRSQLYVDHDHKTGAVRGLLCGGCNTGIGQLQDDPDVLVSAAIYLEERKEG